MSKAEERAEKQYPCWRNGIGDGFSQNSAYYGFIDGYHQAEKDLLENEHEQSWRLNEKLWKGIKDIEEASYQYMYDASNDWAYDIPTWKDVQDAFKAGSEWKEELELTWEDIRDIARIYLEEGAVDAVFDVEKHCKEVLKRFKERKEK